MLQITYVGVVIRLNHRTGHGVVYDGDFTEIMAIF